MMHHARGNTSNGHQTLESQASSSMNCRPLGRDLEAEKVMEEEHINVNPIQTLPWLLRRRWTDVRLWLQEMSELHDAIDCGTNHSQNHFDTAIEILQNRFGGI
jgi:hypothetical protein